jgi:acyl-coenzyme A thioesterase PaaI-like protein
MAHTNEQAMASHPDFQTPWAQNILRNPDNKWVTETLHIQYREDTVTNSMFQHTLYTERGIKAHLSFYRPCKEPDAFLAVEHCFLLSVGDGLDGKAGRIHGGFSSLVLDQVCGSCAHNSMPQPLPPATATMTVDFKHTIDTPGQVLARAWMIEASGRKMWVKGVIEDSRGNLCAQAKTLFVAPKIDPSKL